MNNRVKFRKKPILIEAHRWFQNGDHPEDASEQAQSPEGMPFLTEGKIVRRFRRPDVSGFKMCEHCHGIMDDHGWIDTKEGGHIVRPGDWIIPGIVNEKYPCKPDIFAASYEAVA